MSNDTLFDGFDQFEHAQHADEARERWGDTDAYRESMRRTRGYGRQDCLRMQEEGALLLDEMATLLAAGRTSGDPAAMELAERHRLQIDYWFYPCDHEMHRRLGDMYVVDPRFTAFYERRAPGLAQWLSEAIRANDVCAG